MKTLYLHIGQQKTGSTSLQRFCSKNREVFNKHGFDYPIMPFRYRFVTKSRNAHFLIGTILDKEGNHKVIKEKRRYRKGYRAIVEAFKKYDNVLMSDERLWDRSSAREPFWIDLTEHAKKHGYTIKVIVYLRRQDQLAASWYNQLVKQGSRGVGEVTWEHWLKHRQRYIGDIRLDFYDNLERIAAYVGRENIDVRVYDRAQLEKDGGSIFTDFLGCLGLTLDETFEMPERDNNAASLTPNILATKREVNSSPHHERADDKPFQAAANEYSLEPSDTPRYSLFSADEARAFLAQFEEQNDLVAREYLHRDGPLFDETMKDAEKWSPDNPYLYDDMVHYFQRVNVKQQEFVAERAERLKARAAAAAEGGGAEAGQLEDEDDLTDQDAPEDEAADAEEQEVSEDEAAQTSEGQDVSEAEPQAQTEEADSEASPDPVEWFSYLENREIKKSEVNLAVARCMGDFFLLRQMDVKAFRPLTPLDDDSIERMAAMLHAQAEQVAELQEVLAKKPGARIKKSENAAGEFFDKAGRAISHPGKIVEYVQRKRDNE